MHVFSNSIELGIDSGNCRKVKVSSEAGNQETLLVLDLECLPLEVSLLSVLTFRIHC